MRRLKCIEIKVQGFSSQSTNGVWKKNWSFVRSLFVSQKAVTVHYKGFTREEPLRFDILVEESLLVEAKSVAKVLPIHKAQLLSYMKLLNVPVGLLLNFNEIRLVDGVHRLILPGANR
jgi:GxxExxY protein